MLFNYVSGGTFPPSFLVKNTYDYQNKKLTVQAISLNPFYKKAQDFDEASIKKYIDDNQDNLKEDFKGNCKGNLKSKLKRELKK